MDRVSALTEARDHLAAALRYGLIEDADTRAHVAKAHEHVRQLCLAAESAVRMVRIGDHTPEAVR